MKVKRSRYVKGPRQKFTSLLMNDVIVVQITRRIKRTLQKSVVAHAVAERQKWAKFGQEKGSKPGPDRATTTVGENVTLKLSVGNKVRLFLSFFLSFLS